MTQNNPASGDAFYSSQYTRIYGQLASEIRKEAFGEDFGQESWRSPAEQTEIAALLGLGPGTRVLDVACGAGGPSLALVEQTGCSLVGIDIVPEGVSSATAEAVKRGLGYRATFVVLDGGEPLPFEDGTFDAIACIDAIGHLPDRHSTLREWARLLKAGGRLVFTDPVVVTGALSKPEIDARCAVVPNVPNVFFVPPGFNEGAVTAAGLVLLRSVDRAAATAEIAGRWRAARERRAEALMREEGEDWFERRQVMLNMTAHLASERRLTRFFYLAEKREELASQ
jgi:SAM-dependent methyltransferase